MNNESTSTNKDEHSDDERLVALALQTHLDAKVETLDFNVTSKLSSARHRALASESATVNKSWFSRFFESPVMLSGVAVMAITVFLGAQFIPQSDEIQVVPLSTELQLTQSDMLQDISILTANEDLEFFESMEFLEWMASNSS